MSKEVMICPRFKSCSFRGDSKHCGIHEETRYCGISCIDNVTCVPYIPEQPKKPATCQHTWSWAEGQTHAELDRIAEGTDGIALIAQERNRQIKAEGWTEEHDKQHSRGELSMAATCYTLVAVDQIKKYPSAEVMPSFWPWHHLWWKPTKDPIRNLVKAGALIAAEIDRIQAYIQAQKGS